MLYLRPFRHDQAASRPHTVYFLSGIKTQEEQISDAFARIGRLVAIRQPGLELNYLGALPITASSAEWRDEVIAQMRRASVILIRAQMGSPGVAAGAREDAVIWELRTAVEMASPKTLYLLVPSEAGEYERFRTAANCFLPQSLPQWNFTDQRDTDVAGIISFDEEWNASVHRLQVRSWSPYPLQRALRLFIRHTPALRAVSGWSLLVPAKSLALGVVYVGRAWV